jgi:tetratricopeptide (TPR) repeat protein
MQDDFAAAHETLGQAKSLLETLGPTMTAAITQPAALIAMLAGDPATAERYLQLEFDSFAQMGEQRLLVTTAGVLARAIAAQGPERYGEALGLIAISQEADDGDVSALAIGRSVHARILADQGHLQMAEELARSAAALSARTDLLSECADILFELCYVLAAAGRSAEARSTASQALRLYQSKGNLPGARGALRYLA